MKPNRQSATACGVHGCTRERAQWQMACGFHWCRLPDKLRREVSEAYREKKDGPRHKAAVKAVFDHWGIERLE